MKVPKVLENIFAFYPALQTTLMSVLAFWFFRSLDMIALTALIFVAYFLSPLIWKGLKLVFGGKTEGAFFIGKRAPQGNLWFLYFQLQSIYTHFSVFERVLKIFPGTYSAWLRLWGSEIGKKVNWTPECQIVDRGHLHIGDRALIGNRVYMAAHALKKRNDRYFLYVKGIRIGADTVISYAATVGPGAVVGSRAHIDAGAGLYVNAQVGDGERFIYVQDALGVDKTERSFHDPMAEL